MTISHPRLLALGFLLTAAACGGEGLTLPPEGEAANIEVLAEGNGQSGRVDDTLALPLVVRVTDSRDRTVANANVVFTFTNGVPAEAIPASATTGADGLASVELKLGSQAGPITGMAEVPVDAGIRPVQATFTATALPADANGIALVSGDPQSGTINTALAEPLVVQVTDFRGNPIGNVTVLWAAETGGGSVSQPSTTTGADGRTSVIRILGSTAGTQTTSATAAGLSGSPVIFTHTATAGSASRVEKFSGDNQGANPGQPLAQPVVVRVLDGANNPIPSRAVTWVIGDGGGSVSPENTTTDAEGKASTTWTLGPAVGTNTLNAVVSGVGTATFTATANAGNVSASNSGVGASPGTITVGTGSSTITVTARDGNNNPVAGTSVSLQSTGTGNTFNAASATTGSNGVATFTFSSTVAETKTITATAGGVTISDVATVTVQKVTSSVEITNDDPDPSTVGTPVMVEFEVSGSGGPPTGEVVVTISNGAPTETCRATLSNGSGSCSLPVTQPGTGSNNRRVITATYGGDARFAGDTDTENHTVPNLPPVAQNDASQTNEDEAVTVAVLANDQDPEGATLTAREASDPPNGSVVVNGDNTITYTPDPDFFGTDQFTYRANDGNSSSAPATVTITVNAVNDQPSFTPGQNDTTAASALEPTTVFGWATNITAGPANESGQALDFRITTDNVELFGVGGFPTISTADGTLTYRGNGSIGTANVTVQLHDDGGGNDLSVAHTFTITFVPGQVRLK